MFDLRRETLQQLVGAFRRLEAQVPQPKVVLLDGHEVLRYVERLPQQAIVQKLARYISGLQAMEWLNFNGFVQEQAVIQRTVDDIDEDIFYLVLGMQFGFNKMHRRFLDRFWQEEFEEGARPIDSTTTRYQVSRTDIRGWIEGKLGSLPNSEEAKASRLIQQVYSGYVHAASPHIMEMCGGDPPRFFINGLRGTTRQKDHEQDLWNYVFRGLLAMIVAVRSFGDAELDAELNTFRDDFERRSGVNYKETAPQPV